jgi:DNA invertase Pin-like site-specific DNA recombinase
MPYDGFMVKAFGYLRVSGKGQLDGDGFPRQLAAIKKYATAHDIKIVTVFREEGVRTIIIERLDRLARDLMVQEATIADLRKHGFTVISVAEPDLMENDPSRKAFRQMMGVFAEYEKDTIVAKLRGARMRMRAKEGRCEGRKPYGFYDGEGAVIERMNALRSTGLGFDRIAAKLNAEGLKTRTGARWHGLVVNRILTGKGKKAA